MIRSCNFLPRRVISLYSLWYSGTFFYISSIKALFYYERIEETVPSKLWYSARLVKFGIFYDFVKRLVLVFLIFRKKDCLWCLRNPLHIYHLGFLLLIPNHLRRIIIFSSFFRYVSGFFLLLSSRELEE